MKQGLRTSVVFLAGVLLTLIVLAVLGVFSSSEAPLESLVQPLGGESTAESKTPYLASSLAGATQITCTYPQVLSVSYMDDEVSHSLPPKETEPMIFTFTNLGAQVATLKFIDATRTISETPVYKLYEAPHRLVFIDGDGSGYLTTHTIFLDQGVSVYSKEVDLLGIPSGSLAMGTCVGY